MNLRLKEACAIAHVGENTMRRWADAGIVATVRYGRETRYVEASVRQIAEHGTASIQARIAEAEARAAHTRIDTQRRMAIRALEDELAEIIRDVARLNKRQTWIRERLASIQAAEAL